MYNQDVSVKNEASKKSCLTPVKWQVLEAVSFCIQLFLWRRMPAPGVRKQKSRHQGQGRGRGTWALESRLWHAVAGRTFPLCSWGEASAGGDVSFPFSSFLILPPTTLSLKITTDSFSPIGGSVVLQMASEPRPVKWWPWFLAFVAGTFV